MIWFQFFFSFSFITSKKNSFGFFYCHIILYRFHQVNGIHFCFLIHDWTSAFLNNPLTEFTYTQHTHNYIRLSVTLKQEIKYIAKTERISSSIRLKISIFFFTNDFRCWKRKTTFFLSKNGKSDWASSDWDMMTFELEMNEFKSDNKTG